MSALHESFRLISTMGDAIILLMYLLLVAGWVTQESWRYLLSNAFGSSLLLFDILHDFSLAQCCVDLGWLIISAVALFSAIRARFRTKRSLQPANDHWIPDADVIVFMKDDRG